MAKYKNIARVIMGHDDIIRALLSRDFCPGDFINKGFSCVSGNNSLPCPIMLGAGGNTCNECWEQNAELGHSNDAKVCYTQLRDKLLEQLPKPHADTKPEQNKMLMNS